MSAGTQIVKMKNTEWKQTTNVALTPVTNDAAGIAAINKDRVGNLNELRDIAHLFYVAPAVPVDAAAAHLTESALAALRDLRARLQEAVWTVPELSATVKQTLAATGLKMPQVAIPLRVALFGQTQSAAIDKALAVLGKIETLKRIDRVL